MNVLFLKEHENSYVNKSDVRGSVTSMKTSSVMKGASESVTPFPRFYWNVTCIPELHHNYAHSQRPTLNVPDGILSQSFVLLLMQRDSICNNFHWKALIITDTWIIKCNFSRNRSRMVQIIIIIWELFSRVYFKGRTFLQSIKWIFSPPK